MVNDSERIRKTVKWLVIIGVVAVLAWIFKDAAIEKINSVRNTIADGRLREENTIVKRDNGVSDYALNDDSLCISRTNETISLEKLQIDSITADSVLVSSKGKTYAPENMIDGDLKSSWQEGMEDYGQGCIITMKLSGTPGFLVICNGNQKDEGSFYKNNRVRELRISFGNQTTSIELEDSMEPQTFQISGIHDITEMIIEICSVYEGTQYNDTCIAEIECY